MSTRHGPACHDAITLGDHIVDPLFEIGKRHRHAPHSLDKSGGATSAIRQAVIHEIVRPESADFVEALLAPNTSDRITHQLLVLLSLVHRHSPCANNRSTASRMVRSSVWRGSSAQASVRPSTRANNI